MYHSCGISWHTLGDLNSLVHAYTWTYPHTHHTHHTHTHAHAHSHTRTHKHTHTHVHIHGTSKSRDLWYILIWQYINTLIENHIMMLCFISTEMVICTSQKITAMNLTFQLMVGDIKNLTFCNRNTLRITIRFTYVSWLRNNRITHIKIKLRT